MMVVVVSARFGGLSALLFGFDCPVSCGVATLLVPIVCLGSGGCRARPSRSWRVAADGSDLPWLLLVWAVCLGLELGFGL